MAAQQPQQPNVVFILADNVGVTWVPYGGGECGRADEIGEHYGHLPSLGIMPLLRLRRGSARRLSRAGGSGSGTGKLADRAQHLTAMAKQNSDVLKVLLGQIRKNGDVDAVLGKAALMFGQTERGQPLGNRSHRMFSCGHIDPQ